MSHSTHGGFLLQRYCPRGIAWFSLFNPSRGFYRRRIPTIYPHRSHIISADVTSGMPCPRLSKSIVSMAIFILKSTKSALYPTHKWAGFTAQWIKLMPKEKNKTAPYREIFLSLKS